MTELKEPPTLPLFFFFAFSTHTKKFKKKPVSLKGKQILEKFAVVESSKFN